MCKKSLAEKSLTYTQFHSLELEAHINKLGPVKGMLRMAAERGTISFYFKCLRRVARHQC